MRIIIPIMYYSMIALLLTTIIAMQIRIYIWLPLQIANASSMIVEKITAYPNIIPSEIINNIITDIIVINILVHASILSMIAIIIPPTILAIRGSLPKMVDKRLGIYIMLFTALSIISPFIAFYIHYFSVDGVISRIEYQIDDSDYAEIVYIYNNAINEFVPVSLILGIFTLIIALIIMAMTSLRKYFNTSYQKVQS